MEPLNKFSKVKENTDEPLLDNESDISPDTTIKSKDEVLVEALFFILISGGLLALLIWLKSTNLFAYKFNIFAEGVRYYQKYWNGMYAWYGKSLNMLSVITILSLTLAILNDRVISHKPGDDKTSMFESSLCLSGFIYIFFFIFIPLIFG